MNAPASLLTGITNEPDDQESLVRFLVCANELEVEGLIATTPTWLRACTSVHKIQGVTDDGEPNLHAYRRVILKIDD